MQDFTKENLKQKLDNLNSIQYMFSKDKEDIEKSLVDNIQFTNDNLIEKTGKEVKEKLMESLVMKQAEKISLKDRMSEYVQEIGEFPKEKNRSYNVKNFRKVLSEIPMKYGYDQMFSDGQEETEKKKNMRSYNALACEFIDVCIEYIKIVTAIKNISDNKKVKVSLQSAAKLGF